MTQAAHVTWHSETYAAVWDGVGVGRPPQQPISNGVGMYLSRNGRLNRDEGMW